MVEITIFQVNVEEGSFAANLPFSSGSPRLSDEEEGDENDEDDEAAAFDDEDDGGSKGPLLLGILVLLLVGTAVVKYLTGADEDDPATPA